MRQLARRGRSWRLSSSEGALREESINRTAGQLERQFQEREALLQAVSHEMGTPLSRMRFQVELLESEGPPIIELSCPPGIRVAADRRQFERAIENLLRNAVRYAQDRVTVTVSTVHGAYRLRTIVDHGIQAGIHGDGVHIAPLNPWQHIHYATTGLNSFGAQVNGDQQLTREEALRLFTRGNSWFLRMEDRIGSIEPGKLADLVVLDRDYFSVPDAEIRQIRSLLTIVGGRVVHDAIAA